VCVHCNLRKTPPLYCIALIFSNSLHGLIRGLSCFQSRNRTAKHFRHRASPDSHTVASYDSSGSESRGGLNRYYKQAWDNLQEGGVAQAKLKKQELGRGAARDPMRDASEIIVDNKRRHHHHHSHHPEGDWRNNARANVKPKNRY
jgi:hypothetical protein